MRQETAEKHIKRIQREFLIRIEEHPVCEVLEDDEFNALRRRVFRGTFDAYRLGVIGLGANGPSQWVSFFHWLDEATVYLGPTMQREVSLLCFEAALTAFRVGAMVAAEREER